MPSVTVEFMAGQCGRTVRANGAITFPPQRLHFLPSIEFYAAINNPESAGQDAGTNRISECTCIE